MTPPMSGSKPLEQVIADWRSDAQVLRSRGHERDAALIEEFASDVVKSAEEYLRFIPESDASLMSARSVKWLRSMFPEWEQMGNARKGEAGRREYRMLVLPRRANVSAAREEGRRAARDEAA